MNNALLRLLLFCSVMVAFIGAVPANDPPPGSTGTWSVSGTDTVDQIAGPVGGARTYRVASDGSSTGNVEAKVKKADGTYDVSKTVTIEPGNSADVDLATGEKLEVHHVGAGGARTGTYERL